jgi:hypothetical protein
VGKTHQIVLENALLDSLLVEVAFDFVSPRFGNPVPFMAISIDGGISIPVPEWRADQNGRCHRCGYSLKGLSLDEYCGAKCPECGAWTPVKA